MEHKTSTGQQPTFTGLIYSTKDALTIIEKTLDGTLKFFPRVKQSEREALLKSGAVFVYQDSRSKTTRWGDGRVWSPSRNAGNFLMYRESFLDPSSPSTGKASKVALPRDRRPVTESPFSSKEQQRAIVGPLVDSYLFVSGGLMKKTIHVTCNETRYHLVCYYSVEDVLSGKLQRPGEVYPDCIIRDGIILNQNFTKSILDELDEIPGLSPVQNRIFYPTVSFGSTSQAVQQNPSDRLMASLNSGSQYSVAAEALTAASDAFSGMADSDGELYVRPQDLQLRRSRPQIVLSQDYQSQDNQSQDNQPQDNQPQNHQPQNHQPQNHQPQNHQPQNHHLQNHQAQDYQSQDSLLQDSLLQDSLLQDSLLQNSQWQNFLSQNFQPQPVQSQTLQLEQELQELQQFQQMQQLQQMQQVQQLQQLQQMQQFQQMQQMQQMQQLQSTQQLHPMQQLQPLTIHQGGVFPESTQHEGQTQLLHLA